MSTSADVLRLATVGSVDDGKSTLIGRLLLDLGRVPTDQLAAVESASRQRGDEYVDLALLTDGLRAEREQGITIDVAYRYFSTERRSFILADCPGHPQYTRNVVTGTSLADVAVLLVDARYGLTQQTKCHAFIASLMRVPHVVLCVNKMDLVGFDVSVYEAIASDFTAFAARLSAVDVTAIPTCALNGDNVVSRSANMPWYEGVTLRHYLEHVHIASDRNLVDVRFPIQSVIRPRSLGRSDYRAYAGQVAGGVMRPGDDVVALPSGVITTIAALEVFGSKVDVAFPPMCVSVILRDDVDLSRGDMLARPHNRPRVGHDIEAMVCVVGDVELAAGDMFELRHTTRSVRATVEELRYRVDIESLHRRMDPEALEQNDIGRIRLRTTSPLLFDAYRENRVTGGFILLSARDNTTVAVGVIIGAAADDAPIDS